VSDEEVVATEGTVALLGGHPVGIGNISERTYALSDGTARCGLTSMLSFTDDTTLIARPGSELDLAGARWRVIHVAEGSAAPGSVTFLPDPARPRSDQRRPDGVEPRGGGVPLEVVRTPLA
jgi:hypothetical protein